MSHIRLRYSGLVLFSAQIVSNIISFAFIVFVGRSLMVHEFGGWFFVGSALAYFHLTKRLLPFWFLRDLARGKKVGGIGLLANVLFSLPFLALFLLLSTLFFVKITGLPLAVFLIASFFIPVYFTIQALNAIIRAKYPQRLAPYNIIVDTMKFIFIFLLLQYGLEGVLLSHLIALMIYILYALMAARSELHGGSFSDVKRWLLLSWLPLYAVIGAEATSSIDTFLMGLLAPMAALASLGVALTLSNAIKSITVMLTGLYPKILGLGEARDQDLTAIIKLMFLFLIPSIIGGFVLGPRLVGIFGSRYMDALIPFYIILLGKPFSTMAAVADPIIKGIEKIDLKKEFSYKSMIRSSLFKLYSLRFVNLVVSILLLFVLIPLLGAVGVAIYLTLMAFVTFIVKSKVFNLFALWKRVLPVRALVYYTFSALIMALILQIINVPFKVFYTLLLIFIGAIVYFAVLSIVDRESRSLIYSIYQELRKISFNILPNFD